MKILVDENMPYARELFSRTGDVVAVPGRAIPPELLNHADGLMVRSVTHVNGPLLTGTPVKFVGSATAGTDHIDHQALLARGTAFSAAPGCNAIAVVEYVLSALLLLAERDGFLLSERTVGIVGVGNVGARLQQRLQALGVRTLLCDPPRAEREKDRHFTDVDSLIAEADILTLHTPLYKDGPFRSWHLMDETRLQALKPASILINACRGAVVDNQALLRLLQQRSDLSVVLDVWEPEPDLSLALLAKVDIATAHIAGYTLEGKARGTTQVYEAWCRFLGAPDPVALASLLPVADFSAVDLHGAVDQATLKRLAHLVYDVRRDDALLRKHAALAGGFDRLRKTYQERREWSSLHVTCDNQQIASQLNALGFSASVR
ncbi:4-phosphoerythronate dehydrogenase [Erwinia sp. OLTSP20]|uniref:4-phosphoerythronate dehydrogenase PdxB n=1 Tax=unclassified Erwinia TaxID=2622719 RepID=UPI000C19994E|nr:MULTISPECIES: 4-phosphoerythronate dehydrogenase PdxB [unclassified Erwinia]PIJ51512.1 4-phosphoerythronate dehydrogenase [Erwinia sp. OAMSP11]PIJ75901.1 4-phosphoerythronate dehydrogenase [Erwinia sp. OLSSP12]PIJ83423.1 4-phosphoerythronate dehydrogenase [Erwinia sp. OLCASP19]PIJ86256.1 4-phosphoerythronate dehydrogenase [Erwinia sp. OLMTSP26]PIJ88501.1 4-phosphoerythronate dehydrogenase [Erwinia sp. OLMDSP33]